MKNLNKYGQICIDELNAIGIYPARVAEWKVNTRATNRWGQCEHVRYTATYIIQIASCLLDDNASERGLKETIIHELLHTLDGCDNHGDKWNYYARKVNNVYGYHIKRTDSYRDKGFDSNPLRGEDKMKYWVVCPRCSRKWGYIRKSKNISAIMRGSTDYTCPCGFNKLKVISV